MIKVYSKPLCIQCTMTKNFLSQHDIPFEEINVLADEAVLELIKSKGCFSLPVVTTNDSFDGAWCGFRIDKLEELV